jgi:hypothetical protein
MSTDEQRSGRKPILRRVWAPKGQRAVVTISPRYRWRSLCGYVHPASGRTQWHLGSTSNVELCSRSLDARWTPWPSRREQVLATSSCWSWIRLAGTGANGWSFRRIGIWRPYLPTRLSYRRRSGCGPSPTRRCSIGDRRIGRSWTRSNWTAAPRGRAIPPW